MQTDTSLKTKRYDSRQRKQLMINFIHEFRRVRQYSPTYKEIAKGIGIRESSQGDVQKWAKALVDEGWLGGGDGARTLYPLKSRSKLYAPIIDPDLQEIERQQHNLKILRRL